LLTITTPTICYSDVSKWILHTGSTYHICPRRDWFANFEKLDDSLVQIGDDSSCSMDGVGAVISRCLIRWWETEICETRYSDEEEPYLDWSFGGTWLRIFW